MSHRVIIIESFRELFQEPDVESAIASTLSTAQCNRINTICNDPGEPSDEDFRFLTRKLNQLYTSDE